MKIKTAKDLTDQQILTALKECEGNKMKATATLKCARSYLYKRLKNNNKIAITEFHELVFQSKYLDWKMTMCLLK